MVMHYIRIPKAGIDNTWIHVLVSGKRDSGLGEQPDGNMRLSHKDYDALLKAILELHEHRELEAFRKAIPGLLLGLIPAEWAGMLRYVVKEGNGKPCMDDLVCSDERFTPQAKEEFAENLGDHPIADYYLKGGLFPAVKESDFHSKTQLRNSKFWRAHSMVKLDEALYLRVESRQGMASLSVARWGKSFMERDRQMLNLLRPHFDQAHRDVRLIAAACRSGARPLSAYGLLPRETEVARWVAMGKTNPEIGVILDISPRTVDKHAERIFEKLGVENRTTAAVLLAQASTVESSGNGSLRAAW